MADEQWMDEFLVPDASDHDSGTNWQPGLTPEPPRVTGFRSDEFDDTLLLAGSNFGVEESDANRQQGHDYRGSISEIVYGCETTVPALNTGANNQGAGFHFSANNVPDFDHSQMRSDNANNWQYAHEHQPALPTFNFQYDNEMPIDEQQNNVGGYSTSLCQNASYGQEDEQADGSAIQYLAGNMYGPPGEHHRHSRSLCGKVPRLPGASIPDRSGINNTHSPPWNPLGLRDVPNMAASCTVCTYSGSSSRDCSCLLLSSAQTSETTPGSAFTRMEDSFDTVRDAAFESAVNQFPQHQMSGFNDNPWAVYGPRDGLYIPEPCIQYLSPHLEAGGTPRSRPSVSIHTDTTSQYSSAISPASITPSHDSGTLYCPYDDCPAKFKGRHGRGNLGRHKRQKHMGSGSQRYPCVVDGCSKIYLRQDARLKHYRKRHAGVVST